MAKRRWARRPAWPAAAARERRAWHVAHGARPMMRRIVTEWGWALPLHVRRHVVSKWRPLLRGRHIRGKLSVSLIVVLHWHWS